MSIQAPPILPGFDSLRLLAALSVLFSHAFLIAQGSEASEPLQHLIQDGKNIAGLYGVFTFFMISGYLLASSLQRNADGLRFCVNRSLRLLPGFLCCVLFSALVIGPLCSDLPLDAYLKAPELGRYLWQSLSTLADAPLPGVFDYAGPFSEVVNGSLWSLRAEVLCYVLLLLLWTLLPAAGWVALVFTLGGGAALWNPALLSWLPDNIGYPMPFFAAGVTFWWLTHHLGRSRLIAQLCCGGLLAGALLGFPHQAFAVFGAYLVIHAGHQRSPLSGWIERHGDLSYGLFLFGWPIQQAIRQWLDLRQPLLLLLLSGIATVAVAWALHHGIERPALRGRRPLLLWLRGNGAQIGRPPEPTEG